MCRFVAYLGPSIAIESLTTRPAHSIVKQSYRAKERDEPLNGDGFGVAWYAPHLHPEPAAYRAVTPAWSDENLLHLARVTESGCVLAHVRAATPGLGVSPFNCHPFTGDGLAFMHNGHIADFARLKRPLVEELPDGLWYGLRGTTDSEVLFALLRHRLADARGAPHERLAAALAGTIARLLEVARAHGVEEAHYLNLCVTDGAAMAVSRYASRADAEPETLYWHEGARYVCDGDACAMIAPDEAGGAVIVASERLSADEGWEAVPRDHLVVVSADRSVRVAPL